MRTGLPCATKLRLLLNYDPITGALTWRLSARRGYKPGDVAGSVHAGKGVRNPYRMVVIKGRQHYAHRIIWKMMTGMDPVGTVDHVDTDGLNNVWSNLREASRSQNSQNRRLHKNNTSGVKGVHPEGNKWRAIIKKDRVLFDLGRFNSVDIAKVEIEAMRLDLHAEFARSV